MSRFYVSRQRPYYAQVYQVEVASGGADYAGADAMVGGLNREFTSKVAAVEAAIEDGRCWKRALPAGTPVYLAVGSTGGILTEIEADCEVDDVAAVEAVLAEAQAHDNTLPRCDACGDIIETQWSTENDDICCSERCCDWFRLWAEAEADAADDDLDTDNASA